MLFGMFNRNDINKGVEKCKATDGAVLLDVRTKEEYNDYHIESSINIPLQELGNVDKKITDKNTPIFVYCLSGSRSESAVGFLKSRGYTQVVNIGGISSYRGKTV